ncbi:MAG: penicillin-binding protein 2 [Hyphomicrobium sp.]
MFKHDDEEQTAKRRFSRRAIVVGGAQTAGVGLLGWRLFQLQVVEEGRYAPLAEENRINIQVIAPKRGRIFDRRGAVLADNEETFRATVTPSLAGDVAGVLNRFRLIHPMSQDDIEKLAKRAKKQSRNAPLIIANDLNFEQVAKINMLAPHLPGVRTEVAWRRKYPHGSAVGHVVGYVGSVERAGVDDDAVLRLPGMRIGKSGIEAGLETELRGEGGAQKIEVDARGHIVRNLETLEPRAGADLTLSIDTDLQRKVLDRLQRERRSTAVVIDIPTGEVVVMATTPGYDPAEIVDGISEESWQRLMSAEDKPMLNRAISGQYPPGSTFKMVTALAGLHANLIDPAERIACTGRYELGEQVYRCWKRSGHGKVNLHQALRESCDCYFFDLARRIGIEGIADMARVLGLGQTFTCGLAQQKAGLVPDADWKRGRWGAGWLTGETLLAGIGQGYVLSTPLQLAVMTARIATGTAVEPTMLRRGAAEPARQFASLGLDEAKLQAIRRAMIAVVNEDGGTGGNAMLADATLRVAGKTGTSQVSRLSSETAQNDLPWEQRDHALFVAYVPVNAPRYAIATIVEHGGGGGATAAPLAKDILDAVFAAQLDVASAPAATGDAAAPDGRANAARTRDPKG